METTPYNVINELKQEEKNIIYHNIYVDQIVKPELARPIGRDGLPTNVPLKDEKLNTKMYWEAENQTVGLLIAFPCFIFGILLIGFSNHTFDVLFGAVMWFFDGIKAILPVV